MKQILIAPYKMGSASAKALALAINARRIKGHKRFKSNSVIVNWGRSDLKIQGWPYKIMNHPTSVVQATNKLFCLNRLRESGVSCVEHTTNPNEVMRWLSKSNVVVYGRQLLNASQGRGIVIIKSLEDIKICPLYTKGIIKSHEYRVHVYKDNILDVTKKRRRNGHETSDYIKNLANGWVYCREGISIPNNLLTCAKQAINVLGLDFGAVDLLYHKGIPYVLEINTAPGLQGTTLTKYAQAINNERFVYER